MNVQYKGEGLSARTGCVAAVVGSTTAGMSGPPSVTGTSLPTVTTTPASALPQLEKAAGWPFIDPAFTRSEYGNIICGKKKMVPGMLVGVSRVSPNACRVTFLLQVPVIGQEHIIE
jgi:hypothetical protein